MDLDFDKRFTQIFSTLGQSTYKTYSPTIKSYKSHLIPFQSSRLSSQTSIFKSTTLQHEKLTLLHKVDQLTAQQQRQQYILQKQTNKIKHLQQIVSQYDDKNNLCLEQIEKLKLYSKQICDSVDQKIKFMNVVEEDKKQVMGDYGVKSKDYQGLLENYKREKSAVVEKLNYMNDLENSLKQKQKKIQQHQFYLKKQWQKFEQSKKQLQSEQLPQPPPPPIRRTSSSRPYDLDQQIPQSQKQKNERQQILRTPIKKLFKHHNNEIYDITFNYNGNIIATCGGDRSIKLYDVLNFKSGITIQSHSVDSIFLTLSLDYSGDKMITGSTDRSVQVYSTSSGKQLHSFVGHGYKVNSVSWSSAKEKCVSGSEDKQIKIWQIEKASNLLSIPCGKPVKFISCNSIQPVIYSGHSDGSVRLYSMTQSSTPIAQIKTPNEYPINNISILSNRSHILISTQQSTPLYIIDLKMNKIIHKYESKQFSNTLVRAELSPTQKYIVAGNNDGSIYYWNKDKENLEKKIWCQGGHQKTVTTMKYHFISGVLVSCDKEGNVVVWQ